MAPNFDLESLSRDNSEYSSISVEDVNLHSKSLEAGFEDEFLHDAVSITRPLPTWQRYGKRVLWILVPTFLHPSPPNAAPRPLHPSAWLDGLRGIAAFFVVCHHWSLIAMPADMRRGFMTDDHPMFLQIPIVRLAVSGRSAVCVFFVISGYALSYKPAKLTIQPKNGDFTTAIASSVFRRYLRLFLPTMATSLSVACLAYFKLYENEPVPNQAGVHFRPPVLDTFSGQMKSWWSAFGTLSDPFSRDLDRGNNFAYDTVLWTIPIEYQGSLIVFLTHVAFYRLRPRIRIFLSVFLMAYTIHCGYWHFFLFLSGLCLATLNFYGQVKQNTHEPASLMLSLTSTTMTFESFGSSFSSLLSSGKDNVGKKAFQIVSFIGALWLLSWPEATASIAPGYRTIAALTPARHGGGDNFWISIAAVWLVFTIDKSPVIKPIFTNRYSQYLGRISYSIYLVHHSIIWLFGVHLLRLFAAVTGSPFQANSSSVSWAISVILATVFFLPVTIYVADFVQRYVDAQSVTFSAWVESKLVSRTK